VPTLTGISPVLLIADVERSVEYYRDRLGFEVETYGDPPDFVTARRDDATSRSASRSEDRPLAVRAASHRSPVRRRLLPWVVAGLVVSALFWIDPLFIPLALLGPLVTGALTGWLGRGLRLVVLMWIAAGLGALVSDFVINQEDVVFHLVLTVVMVGLAAGAWSAVRAIRR
jgi:hypothetical protein